jgi:phosphoesterase RecJ-like protein
MTIDWTPLADLIELHDRFLVTTHLRPDGDGLGSEVAMAGLLLQKGKDVRVVNASPTPPRYDFLDPEATLFEQFGAAVHTGDLADREVAVILDLSSWNQLGDMAEFIRLFPGPRVIIDHHVSQDDLGATVFKDPTAEATGMLVMGAIAALGGSVTQEVATGLLTAIAMDTGWFRHSNTRSGTLRAVAELIDAGARLDETYRNLFERNTLGRLKLIGETLRGMQTACDGRIAYATITRDDLLRTGAIPPDSEDVVDFTVSLRGVEVGILFIEQLRGGVKASFRARSGLDCARLAAQFGGGGHKEAAGATLPGSMTECVARVLQAVRAALESVAPAG